ncbi:hypothetical protein MKW92_003479 [Papaver armeniacum]|nr:hypothetical protein MKW92_003479 [Papaver armeniacum]
MAGVSVAAEWQLQHEIYYRKLQIYSMQWQIDFSRNKIACAPFGGPIAVIRDDAKIVQLLAESALRKLNIYNSAGILLSSTRWDRSGGRLIGMSWIDDQTLVCLEQYVVVECVFWGNGMVCLTEGCQIFCISDFENPNPCKLEDLLLEDYPLCIAVIEPQLTVSGNVQVLLGVNYYILVAEGIGPLQRMVLAQNGKFLASFTHDGRILVTSTADYKKILFEYECESAVLLYWDDMLLVVGPFGDPVRYLYDDHGPIILIPECDGVRVLSNTSMELLQLVPESTVSIFSVGSAKPAALLYDALDLFDRRSAKADDYLRSILSELPEAVEACIDAAGHEFDVSWQQTLLRAASYGQSFCSHVNRDQFREMCTTLRVLNAVRNYEIGVPLTIQQYKLLTAPVLIGRLINAHQHLLALRISKYIGLSQQEVVVMHHWACAKITNSPAIDDAALLEMLLDKLKLCKGISYPAVAAQADKSGRRKLAATLVEHEPRSSKQVPFLLSIGEDDTALMKATQSGDTDLFYDSSVSDTIRTCIELGNHQAAMKVRSEFKVSEKRRYWLKAFSLARKRDWDALEKFSKEKKPSIGYRPFVDACIDEDEKIEALKYIPKLRDPTERAESYARIGMAKEAENAATQSKDGKLLGRLKLTFAHNAAASSIFDTLRGRLGVS